jgi:nitroreductase
MTSAPSSCVDDLIRSRRTNLRIDRAQLIDQSVLTEIIELATWAPNHHLTEPWRFAVIRGEARAELGRMTANFQQSLGVTDELKLDKTRLKFLRAPVIIAVACESSEGATTERQREDRDAVAAAIQNLLLTASARGLATYWGSGAVCDAPDVQSLCGFSPTSAILAMIYIGYPVGPVPQTKRAPATITWVG